MADDELDEVALSVIHLAVSAHRKWYDNADECQCGWNLQDPTNDPDVGECGHIAHEIMRVLKVAGLKVVRSEKPRETP